jgi:hypothetical protein
MHLMSLTSYVLKQYVQSAGGPNHYPLCRPLDAFGLDAFLYGDTLKYDEAYPHILVTP